MCMFALLKITSSFFHLYTCTCSATFFHEERACVCEGGTSLLGRACRRVGDRIEQPSLWGWRVTELAELTVAEPVGVESDRTNWTNSGRVCGGRERQN